MSPTALKHGGAATEATPGLSSGLVVGASS